MDPCKASTPALAAFLVTKMTMSTDGCPWPAHQVSLILNSTLRNGAKERPNPDPTLLLGPQSSSQTLGFHTPKVPKLTLSSCSPPPQSNPHQMLMTALSVHTPWTGGRSQGEGLFAGHHSGPGADSGVSMRARPDDEAQTPLQVRQKGRVVGPQNLGMLSPSPHG